MLCILCGIFTEYMLDGQLSDIDRWRPVEGPDYELSIASTARPQISEAEEYVRPCCFNHYPQYMDLEEAARAGCRLCTVIRNSVAPRRPAMPSDRRRKAPVRLCLIPVTHGKGQKRFRVCIGKTTSPLTQTLLELEYY